MNKLNMQLAVVLTIIAILLPVSSVCAKDEKGVTNIAVVRPEAEIYNDIEKGFSDSLKKFNASINIKVIKIAEKKEEIEEKLNNAIKDNPDILVSIGSSTTKAAYTLLKDKKIPLLYIGVTDPMLIGLDPAKRSPQNPFTGVRWGISLKSTFKFYKQVYPQAKRIAVIYVKNYPADIAFIKRIKEMEKELGYKKISYIPIENKEQLLKLNLSPKDYDFYTVWYGYAILDSSLDKIKTDITEKINLPLFGGDAIVGEKVGCAVAVGANLYKEGEQAGAIAINILKGKPANQIAPEDPHMLFTVINMKMARKYGMKMWPEVLESAHKIITP